MEKIPSAEKFLDVFIKKESIPWNQDIEKLYGAINVAMIEFAKLHCIQALKQASKQVATKLKEDVQELSMNDEWTEIDKDSILNSYPLTLVK